MSQATNRSSTTSKNVIDLREWVAKRFLADPKKPKIKPRRIHDWRADDTDFILAQCEAALTKVQKKDEDDHQ